MLDNAKQVAEDSDAADKPNAFNDTNITKTDVSNILFLKFVPFNTPLSVTFAQDGF